ncbi:FtsW/RodA/SpoVE family cell cycle protein [Verrucomicrobiaceae bacterium N1E253]|uniref:Probable peptidoglycan glycosyltransferase FtsW n=2 Tax=Oceaniferula marina TaxID=2748318 RepID=A0A851GGG0_9BACT|nr:FtsW/RodA/SpoVE family cell cycle protein [Oceaniferula marina]
MLTSTSVWDDQVDGYALVKKQAIWIILGVGGAVWLAATDYRKFAPGWAYLFGGVCVLLVLCYVPGIGQEIKGESRWIKVPGLPQFQPSEMAKIIVILGLAAWYAHFQTEGKTFFKGFVYPCLLLGVPVLLIFFEKDMGTAVALAASGVLVMFVAGARIPYLAVSGITALAGMAFVVWKNPERMGRVNALFELESDKYRLGDGYQQLHGIYAFANGGVDGVGLGNGVEKLGYLPEAHTDFIFPAIGEELGLWFTLGSVFCFVVIVVYGIAIAMNAKDIFGRLMAVGLTSIIVVPAMMNIGVCTAVLPNTGLPLPFISYGGTNMIFTLLAVGLLISIHRQTSFVTRQEMPVINEKKHCVRL